MNDFFIENTKQEQQQLTKYNLMSHYIRRHIRGYAFLGADHVQTSENID